MKNAWASYRDLIIAIRFGEYQAAVEHFRKCLGTECETAAKCVLTEALNATRVAA